MSDDLAPGAVSLEDDVTSPPIGVPGTFSQAAPQPAPQAAPAPAPAEDDEPGAVEVAGQRMIPLAAVKEARAREKAAREELARRDTLVAAIQQNLEAVKPHLQILQQHPDLVARLQSGQVPQASAPPVSASTDTDPELVELAQTLDLYTTDAKPDVARAAKLRGQINKTAEQIAQQAVQPIAQSAAYERASRNYQWVLSQKDAAGRSMSEHKPMLDQIWSSMPVEYVADPRVAWTAALLAAGNAAMTQAPAPKAPDAPLHTEGSGGRAVQTRTTLSALEESIARYRGVSPTTWQENTKGYTPGRPSTLED
jgi:hypothetical protein